MPVYTINGKNILFIHIPKTGGSAIGAELAKAGQAHFEDAIAFGNKIIRPKHAHAAILEAVFDPSMFDLVFTVVREPVARMISEFRYQSRKPGVHLAGLLGFDRWLSFSLARCRLDPSYRDNHFRPQSQFPILNTAVFRYEDGLDKPLLEIARVTGHDFPDFPERVNSSPPVAVVASASSRTSINDFFREDFDRFGYVGNT